MDHSYSIQRAYSAKVTRHHLKKAAKLGRKWRKKLAIEGPATLGHAERLLHHFPEQVRLTDTDCEISHAGLTPGKLSIAMPRTYTAERRASALVHYIGVMSASIPFTPPPMSTFPDTPEGNRAFGLWFHAHWDHCLQVGQAFEAAFFGLRRGVFESLVDAEGKVPA